MKLGWKIVLLLLALSFTLFGALGYFEIRRALRDDVARSSTELETIGITVRSSVNEVSRVEGPHRAAEVLKRADDDNDSMHLQWVSLNEPIPRPAAELDVAQRRQLSRGSKVQFEETDGDEVTLHVYIPVSHDSALALSQTLEAKQTVIRQAIEERFVGAGLVVLAAGLVTALASLWVVGRPMEALAEQARRIGSGDLAYRGKIQRRDEIGELAREMNRMCDRLLDARSSIAEAAEARLRTLEQLRRADRLSTVGTLASGMAHELGTPLSIIAGRAKMITVASESTDSPQLAKIILGQTERMTKLMRSLLDFARRKAVEKVPSDLLVIAKRMIELLGPLAKKNGVELILVEGPPLTAQVDVAQVEQALANLIVNAIHATEQGGAIHVSAESGKGVPPDDPGANPVDLVRLVVVDGGQGISPENLPHVFEPFFTTKDVGQGTGLGLSISYGIMQDHGGFIDVSSTEGKGSSFSLCFPCDEVKS